LNTETIVTGQKDLRDLFNVRIKELTHALVNNPECLSDEDLGDGIDAMQQLLSHYFSGQSAHLIKLDNSIVNIEPRKRGWKALDNISRLIAKPNQRNIRLIILGMFSSLLQSKGNIQLDKHARPLIIVEDPETRLHPIML
ncbi:DUF2813 domain-containing protein, partial [Exiguobacterium sp. SL-9]|uniref:DUF2813 domain-containing protein n=2 Tax=Bacteria TaxID=2 RepID=UPI00103E5033